MADVDAKRAKDQAAKDAERARKQDDKDCAGKEHKDGGKGASGADEIMGQDEVNAARDAKKKEQEKEVEPEYPSDSDDEDKLMDYDKKNYEETTNQADRWVAEKLNSPPDEKGESGPFYPLSQFRVYTNLAEKLTDEVFLPRPLQIGRAHV